MIEELDFEEGLTHKERMMREVQLRRTPKERKALLEEALQEYRRKLKSGELDEGFYS